MASKARFQSRGIIGAAAIVLLGSGLSRAVVLDDPLQGSTIGTRSGGTFVAGGWQVGNQYDAIYWHVPTLSHGAFEYNVKGIPGGLSGCPGGAGFKSELSHMYDYTFNNADNQYSPGYQNDPYKQFLRKQCESGKTDTIEIVWQVLPDFHENDTAALSWDVNTTYLFRNEWENAGGNTTLKTIRNGSQILVQTLAGKTWNPAGQSVRIASSTRRADEGAITGSIYSNVKVQDLTTDPGGPTIVAPTSGQTVTSTVVYVQWSGDAHTMYQLQVNAENTPEAAVIYDSQQVSSDRYFAWTGTLSNNATYYAFVRLGNSAGWGPWSSGRNFAVNTAYVPPGPNYNLVKGNSYANNSGPFLGLGFSHFRALQRRRTDPIRYANDLAFMQSKGFRYQRALSMVAWPGLEIAPVGFQGPNNYVDAWPDYDQVFKDAIDIAYDIYGIKTEMTIFADAQWVMPPDSPGNATRTAHLDRVLANIVGREHKIVIIEVVNEYWQNGFPDPGGVSDIRAKGQYLADRTIIPVALSSPNGTDSSLIAMYAGSAADIAMEHMTRDTGTIEGGWLPVRYCYSKAYLPGVPPVDSNEPIGPGSSVSTENDPIKLCMAGVFAWTAGLPGYVFHARAGVTGWTTFPTGPPEVFFTSTPGVDSYQNILPLLPGELSGWERNDGKVAASPFTNYCMGQANKWWTEVGGATNGCDRNIATIKGGQFVTCPIGILGGGLELEARRPMNFQVYDPLTGAVAYSLTKNTGEHTTLAQGPGAYVIQGIFTDVVGPTNEVSIDLGNPDVPLGMTHPQGGDGITTPANIGGRDCRRNIDPTDIYAYFYFAVSDAFAYQGSKPDVYFIFDYYDTGTSTLTLEYDSSTGTGIPAYYRFAGNLTMTNTNTWKSMTFHVTDAYFGNRQNNGADFRIADPGNAFYLDVIVVTDQTPGPPIIAEVSPDPDPVLAGTPYTKLLSLTQGYPAPSWSVIQGPAGVQVNQSGLVTGWTPATGNLGDNTLEIQATNSYGSDTETWVVRVLSRYDFDFDGDSDSSDFGHLQECFSGDTIPYGSGCGDADSNGDGDVDTFDFNAFLPCMAGPNHLPGC